MADGKRENALERWNYMVNSAGHAPEQCLALVDHTSFSFTNAFGDSIVQNANGRFRFDGRTQKWVPDV